MSEPLWDVLGYGAVTVDDLVYVDTYPLPDMKVKVMDERRAGGGLVGTALVAAARLGARAAYAGLLGDDDLSAFTLREFEREGVDCRPVARRAGARPIHSIIIVDATGQRSILPSFIGVAWRAPDEIDDSLVSATRVLLIDHHACPANLKAAAIARRLGIPVVADFERDDDPLVSELLPLADHLIIGARFAAKITGRTEPAEMAAALASPERACAAVTAGERGCWYAERGGPARHAPAYAVRVVDTTGCGDVFHGAYAACLARGLAVPDAIRVASAAAALKATQPGGRQGIPAWPAVTHFLAGAPAPR